MYLFIFCLPLSPPSLTSFSKDGTIIANNCRIIEAVIYGVTDIANTDNFEKAPPDIVLIKPVNVPVEFASCSASIAESTPGTII